MEVAPQPHAYGVQNIVMGEVRDVHFARMRFYANAALAITTELKEDFQHAFTQEEFEMAAFVDMSDAENRSGFEVEVEWVRFDNEDNTWKDPAKIWHAAPPFVTSELRKLVLKRGVRTQLKQQYGMTC